MPATYEFAEFTVDPDRGTLVRGGYTVLLQDQPFRLLVLLLTRAGTVVTRDEIQAHLWPANTYVEFDKSLRVAVSKLREALRDSAVEPVYIETVPRRGYRFISEVTAVAQAGEQPPDPKPAYRAPPEPEMPAPMPAAPVDRAVKQPRPLWFLHGRFAILTGALAIIGAVSLYLTVKDRYSLGKRPVEAHPVLRKSIAVIGLRNLNGSRDDEWLSTALAEMLSTELSVSDRLRVISGEEVARAGLSAPPPNTPSHETLVQYANRLGASTIVYGSYAVSRGQAGSAPPKLRLDLRVEDLSSDAPAMALVETGPATNLFSLVSSSGSRMRERFGLAGVSAESLAVIRRTLPQDPVAAQFYAEGLNRLRNFDPLSARDLLLKAAQLEPGHAGTHLALADAWHSLGYDSEAQKEAARAVDLGGGLPRQELLEMQGQLAMLTNDWTKATDLFRSLYTFYPDDAGYGLRLVKAQYFGSHAADALATLQAMHKAGLSRADEGRIDIAEANAHLQIDDFREAIEAANRAIKIGADLDLKMIRADALWIKASGLERLGNLQESLSASEESRALYQAAGDKHGQGLTTMMTGDVLYDRSQTAEARKSFLASLAFFRELGHSRNSAICLERIGNTYFDEGALTESRQYYRQALDIYRQIHWDSGIASGIGNIANVQDTEGDIAGARRSNEQGLALFQKSGNKRGAADTFDNLGNLEMECGDLDRAAADFNRAAQIDEQIAYGRGLTRARVGQGDVLLARNDVSGAFRQYDLAAKAAAGNDEPEVASAILVSRGRALRLAGNPSQALTEIQKAADNFVRDKNHGSASLALAELSHAQLDRGHTAEALDAANRAVVEARAQFGPYDQLVASLALARVRIAMHAGASVQAELRASRLTAQRHEYLPLAMQAQFLLASSASSPKSRREQLDALAVEAAAHGWKEIAAEARRAHF